VKDLDSSPDSRSQITLTLLMYSPKTIYFECELEKEIICMDISSEIGNYRLFKSNPHISNGIIINYFCIK
jgi:hypothetical protein